MAFRFSLATVLRFRESVEKREELALQTLLLEMARVRREIESASTAIAAAQNARSEALRRTLPALQIQSMDYDVNAAADRRKALLKALEALDQRRIAQTDRYQAAHRDRRMLSDMQTRKRDAWEQERTRAEQRFLDDIFGARAQRS
jgi:flagellar export protein FliJ